MAFLEVNSGLASGAQALFQGLHSCLGGAAMLKVRHTLRATCKAGGWKFLCHVTLGPR